MNVPVSVSAVSFWQMSLKQALGKLSLEGETIEMLVKEYCKNPADKILAFKPYMI
jgi:PIN domain nuclease of toxin-antitoxin system